LHEVARSTIKIIKSSIINYQQISVEIQLISGYQWGIGFQSIEVVAAYAQAGDPDSVAEVLERALLGASVGSFLKRRAKELPRLPRS